LNAASKATEDGAKSVRRDRSDPEGITGGHDDRTPRTVAICEGDAQGDGIGARSS